MPQPPKNQGPKLNPDEVRMLNAVAKFGPIRPTTDADVALIERLEAAGYVAKDPHNPEYSLTVRGWASVRSAAKKDE
jgi:hypothetical protein